MPKQKRVCNVIGGFKEKSYSKREYSYITEEKNFSGRRKK